MGKSHNKGSYQKKWTIVILAILFITVLIITFLFEAQYQNSIPTVAITKVEEKGDTTKTSTVPFSSKESAIHYSLSDYFYEETQVLELSSKESDIKSIYYTLDGTLPDSEGGILYEEPIELASQTKDRLVNSYTIRACGKREDGSFSEIQTHSYFVGEGVGERFDCIVVSLTTAPDNLYDYEDGIFVTGKVRDDYIKENRDAKIQPDSPANFNLRGMESERPVSVEMFTEDGTCIISQKAGMRVSGGWSREYLQKSIKLIARSSYDEGMGSFDYEFFPDASTLDHRKITSYKRLVLRNNANDNGFAFLRDETISECTKETQLIDTVYSRPAAVYLNGKYYGFAWLHSVYDSDYFNAMNGNDEEIGTWKVLDAKERNYLFEAKEDEDLIDQDMLKRYKEVLSYSNVDLTNDDKFNELSQLIDVDNFLWYYAVQAYIGNTDWPNNNNKVYRYYTENEVAAIEKAKTESVSSLTQEEVVSTNQIVTDNNTTDANAAYNNVMVGNTSDYTAMDGKFRWLLFDTDFALGLYNASPSQETVTGLLQPFSGTSSPLLISLLKRDDIKEKYITILCDLMNDIYSPEKVKSVILEKEALRLHELSYDYKYGCMLPSSWGNLDFVSMEVKNAINYAKQRPEAVREQIVTAFGKDLTEYLVTAASNEHAVIHINYSKLMPGEEGFHGVYYLGYALQLSSKVEEGYQFVSWNINGKQYKSQSLELNPDDFFGEEIKIELEVKPKEDATIPVIYEVGFEGKNDYIVLFNPYAYKVTTKLMFLSDDEQNLEKNQLQNITLAPGEKVTIYCDNYQGLESLGGYSVNFSLKGGEILYFSNCYGDIVEKIPLHKVEKGNYLEKDMFTKAYIEKTP